MHYKTAQPGVSYFNRLQESVIIRTYLKEIDDVTVTLPLYLCEQFFHGH